MPKQTNNTPYKQIFAAWEKNIEVLENILQLVIVPMLWGAAEHIFQFVRAVKTHSLRWQKSSFGAAGGITVIRHQCSWEGGTDSGTLLELHTLTETKDPENASTSLNLFQISTSKQLLSFRGSSISFILRMAVPWRSLFSCFFFDPQQLSDPDCSISFCSNGMASGIFSWL